MQLHPTRNALDLSLVGIALLCLGIVTSRAAIAAWGGALLLGLQLARAIPRLNVTRSLAAGFEMLWREPQRTARVSRGEQLVLRGEVRNRDDRAARSVHLRAVYSPHLVVRLEPTSGEVPAGGRLAVDVTVQGSRVGRHGIYGLSLEVQGSPGLYEVPLTFSNPFGVEVMPSVYAQRARPALGGRSRLRADAGRLGRRPMGSYDLREIREYQLGDPFKRIAWKASARRSRLMVRDFDQEERDIVWFLLEASVELWAGAPGRAPLDTAIDAVASLAERELELGNRVGLGVIAARRLVWLRPRGGAAQAAAILEALSFQTSCYDADRSGLDEADVAARILEHMRALDPDLTATLQPGDLDRIARRVNSVLSRAPFGANLPVAHSPRERTLRQYLANFGIDSPPRIQPERPKSSLALASALQDTLLHRPRPSRLIICAPAPALPLEARLADALRLARRRHTRVSWVCVPLRLGAPNRGDDAVSRSVQWALQLRDGSAFSSCRRALRQFGVHVQHCDVAFQVGRTRSLAA